MLTSHPITTDEDDELLYLQILSTGNSNEALIINEKKFDQLASSARIMNWKEHCRDDVIYFKMF